MRKEEKSFLGTRNFMFVEPMAGGSMARTGGGNRPRLQQTDRGDEWGQMCWKHTEG